MNQTAALENTSHAPTFPPEAPLLGVTFGRNLRPRSHAEEVILAVAEGNSVPAKPSASYAELSLTPDEIVPLLRSLRSRSDHVLPLNIADFDGTLIRDSSGGFKIDYAIDNNFLLPVIRPKLDGMFQHFGLLQAAYADPNSPEALGADVRRVKAAFEDWVKLPNTPIEEKNNTTRKFYEMCSWIFAGHTQGEVHDFTRQVLLDTGYGVNYFRGAREIIQALNDSGIPTAVVSATFQPVVETAAAFFGIPARSVMGMNLKIDADGRYLPEMEEPVTFREGKVAAARTLMQRYLEDHDQAGNPQHFVPLLAMGDSPAKTDQQLLEMAVIAIATEPQTPKDAEFAREWFRGGRPGFFLDYEQTIDGSSALKFRRDLEEQVMPSGKFL